MASFAAEAHQTPQGQAVPQPDAVGWDPRITTNARPGSCGPEPNNAHGFQHGKQSGGKDMGPWLRGGIGTHKLGDEN